MAKTRKSKTHVLLVERLPLGAGCPPLYHPPLVALWLVVMCGLFEGLYLAFPSHAL